MSEVSRILSAIEQGDPHAAEQLLPVVYDELRKLAAHKLALEKPGQTLDPTALVHEAYLRLVGGQQFENRRHFFAAAAEAMRRILTERARHKKSLKAGGGAARRELEDHLIFTEDRSQELIEIDDALQKLEKHDCQAAELVKLRFFGGMKHQEAAKLLGLSRPAADRLWMLARTWLYRALRKGPE
jgi:RNA polymerase sigma factor (TIGR02999 family)